MRGKRITFKPKFYVILSTRVYHEKAIIVTLTFIRPPEIYFWLMVDLFPPEWDEKES